MAWTISFRPSAVRELEKRPKDVQERIRDQLEEPRHEPRDKGASLRFGQRQPLLLRYRVGPYRVICQLRDEDRTVLVLRVAHRREAYR